MANFKLFTICLSILIFKLFLINLTIGIPVIDVSNSNLTTTIIPVDSDVGNGTHNGTHKDLYVIKAVVYEIGILTEVSDDDNSTDDEEFSHERVDLTFYDAHNNGSHLDLGDIPLPIQTNVSGQILTGIAPIHLGAVQDAKDILSTLPLTGTIVNITHSDTSFINLSHKPIDSENGAIIDPDDLAKIPGVDGSTLLIDKTYEEGDEDNSNNNNNNEIQQDKHSNSISSSSSSSSNSISSSTSKS